MGIIRDTFKYSKLYNIWDTYIKYLVSEVIIMPEENIVYIGSKPVMNYVLAVVTQMNGGVSEVALKARGRAISRAVDVAEIVRNRFIPDMDVETINISTEEIVGNDGVSTNVSTIEIHLRKDN
jgi:archaea-specific DNA-binding protein